MVKKYKVPLIEACLRDRFLFLLISLLSLILIVPLLVGYGDIIPASLSARSFSILEMVIGQIYLVVLIARLVGIHIAQSIGRNMK